MLSLFQSTRPRGARPILLTDITISLCFNPRAHAGRDNKVTVQMSYNTGFNPRAHAGRDSCRRSRPLCARVSIHAPTRGATSYRCGKLNRKEVSIHAPTRGATKQQHLYLLPLLFQSTRPRGARLIQSIQSLAHQTFQSTRPRGARLTTITTNSKFTCFNPRAHAGRDNSPNKTS